MAKTGRPRTGFPSVAITAVGDVTCATHTLTAQASQLASLTSRIGRRLHHWLRNNPDVLPGPEFVEVFRYYVPALIGLLKEQRDRARLTSDQPPLSDAEYEAGMRELAEDAVLAMSADELADLLRRRGEAS